MTLPPKCETHGCPLVKAMRDAEQRRISRPTDAGSAQGGGKAPGGPVPGRVRVRFRRTSGRNGSSAAAPLPDRASGDIDPP
jgi:hypothetical protein